MPIYFVQHANTTYGRDEPPTIDYFVSANPAQALEIDEWLREFYPDDHPYIGEIHPMTFDEFAADVDMYAEDEEEDGAADHAGD